MRPFLATLVLLLTAVVGINALATWMRSVDDARLRTASGAFVPGQVLIGYRYVNERVFQAQRLGAIPRPRVVAFGSSRVMQLDTALLGLAPGEFYNTALSSGTVEDFIGLWATLLH